jgi:hypothetical protein
MQKKLDTPFKIVIHTPFRGPGNLPAVYTTPESGGVISGYVEYDSDSNYKAGEIEFSFRAKASAKWRGKKLFSIL